MPDPSVSAATFRSSINEHPLHSWLDLRVESVDFGEVILGLPYEERLLNTVEGSNGSVHGGIIATVIDVASAMALRTTYDAPFETAHVTTDLNVSYVRGARSELQAIAEVVRAGRSMGFSIVEVVQADSEVAAFGSASHRIFRPDGRANP